MNLMLSWRFFSTGGAVAALTILAGSPALAQTLTMNGQSRSVAATALAQTSGQPPVADAESNSAAGFSLFSDEVHAGAISSNGLTTSSVSAPAEQWSEFQFSSAFAFGETNVYAEVFSDPSQGSASGTSLSDFSYTFTLDAVTPYRVQGLISRFGPVSDCGIELVNASTGSVFAIGESVGYTQHAINSSGLLAAGTYTLQAFADTEHDWLGPLSPTTAGAEFELLFSVDVFAPGEIVNGQFFAVDGMPDVFGWQTAGPGTASLSGTSGDQSIILQTGSPVSIFQSIDTPDDPFFLDLDYEFLDTDGTLEVRLASQLLATIDAPGSLAGSMTSLRIGVNDPGLLNLAGTELRFTFDGGASGLSLRLDNIGISSVPEAGFGIVAFTAAIGMLVQRRRRIAA